MLFVWMRARVIRTTARRPARSNADPIEPRLHVNAFPHSAPGQLGGALIGAVLALGILRPVQRETVLDQPFPEIGTADRTGRHRSAVAVSADRDAAYRPAALLQPENKDRRLAEMEDSAIMTAHAAMKISAWTFDMVHTAHRLYVPIRTK
jgi:hypothetical protein